MEAIWEIEEMLSSPRSRGYFQTKMLDPGFRTVFPAFAGVFLAESRTSLVLFRLPRIRGGVS